MQLCNDAPFELRLLYIVTPPYVVERDDGRVAYEDAMLLDGWSGPLSSAARETAHRARAAALARMVARRATGT